MCYYFIINSLTLVFVYKYFKLPLFSQWPFNGFVNNCIVKIKKC